MHRGEKQIIKCVLFRFARPADTTSRSRDLSLFRTFTRLSSSSSLWCFATGVFAFAFALALGFKCMVRAFSREVPPASARKALAITKVGFLANNPTAPSPAAQLSSDCRFKVWEGVGLDNVHVLVAAQRCVELMQISWWPAMCGENAD